ncbi:MAG TPA: methyltransferase domain-containing protein, partial [Rhizomicrobium sp.]|nr:methyltransferase domain-containing protein [Rhizomicrobium sp.]
WTPPAVVPMHDADLPKEEVRMSPSRIFDRKAYARRRARASESFLALDAAQGLAERIGAINRRFVHALNLNARPETRTVFAPLADNWIETAPGSVDEEALPFAPESFDLVVSVLSLHAVNDLPGALVQIRRALKPDGLFMAALFGGETLHELREAFASGESETVGGASPHVAPFADVRDLGGLLQRAGFALPVADVERTTVRYRSFDNLVADLRALGETNALAERSRKILRKDTLAAAIAHYKTHHADAEGRIGATFDVIYLSGWSPHESQQKPLPPGSAKMRLEDALKSRDDSTRR